METKKLDTLNAKIKSQGDLRSKPKAKTSERGNTPFPSIRTRSNRLGKQVKENEKTQVFHSHKPVNAKSSKQRRKEINSEKGLIKGKFTLLSHILGALFRKGLSLTDLTKITASKKKLVEPTFLEQVIPSHVEVHNNMIKNLGIKFGTKRYKIIVNYCIQLLEMENPPELPNELQLSTGKVDKWPKIFGHLRPLYHVVKEQGQGAAYFDQILRTIFSIPRMVEDFAEIDLDSIKKPGKNITQVRSAFKEFLKSRIHSPRWGFKFPKVWEFEPSIRNNTQGPLRGPRWNNIDIEAKLLYDGSLWEPFQALAKATGGDKLIDMVKKLASKVDKHVIESRINLARDVPTLRNITAVPDSGNKSRSIAMGDIFTQTLLRPLEKILLELISSKFHYSCDVMNHENGFTRLQQALRPGVQSLDASNWTDRLPAILQRDCLEVLAGSEISDSWYRLVVTCPWNVQRTAQEVRYAVGQGMGIHASFALATVTDIFLIEFAYSQYYPEVYKDMLVNPHKRVHYYNKIGDDLWVYDPDKKFIKFYEDLGVEINLSKSKFATEQNLVAEYVSRNINRGHHVSRISSRLCREAEQNIFVLPMLYQHLHQRLSRDMIEPVFESIYLSGYYKKKFLFENLAKMAILEELAMGTKTFISSCGELVRNLIVRHDPDLGVKLQKFEEAIMKEPVSIACGLLIHLIEKEWISIEKHLNLLSEELKRDRISYYAKTLPINQGEFFDEKLYEEPRAYIVNVQFGLAALVKNTKLNPLIFKGVPDEERTTESLVELRSILIQFKRFAQCFLNLEQEVQDLPNLKYRLHCLYRISTFLRWDQEGNVYDTTNFLNKFKAELEELDKVSSEKESGPSKGVPSPETVSITTSPWLGPL